MTNNMQKSEKEKAKISFFEYVTEVVGWLQIVASPLLAGLIIGALIYFSYPSPLRLVIAVAVVIIALILGIILATRMWKKQGTMHFVSRMMASEEFDDLDKEKK